MQVRILLDLVAGLAAKATNPLTAPLHNVEDEKCILPEADSRETGGQRRRTPRDETGLGRLLAVSMRYVTR
jgi:hypothetical protein